LRLIHLNRSVDHQICPDSDKVAIHRTSGLSDVNNDVTSGVLKDVFGMFFERIVGILEWKLASRQIDWGQFLKVRPLATTRWSKIDHDPDVTRLCDRQAQAPPEVNHGLGQK
jgi:hypothetical protein